MVAAAIIGSVIGAGATVYTGSQQSKAIKKSTNTSVAEQRRQFDIAQELTKPRRDAENAALAQLLNVLGIGTGGQPDFSGVDIPGQQYAIDQSSRAIERSAAGQGGLISGNTLDALQRNALGITNQNFLSNYLNPLVGLATGNANQQAGQNALNLGVNVGNTLQQAGLNRANVIGATGQNVNNAIQGGISNYLVYDYIKKNAPLVAGGTGSGSI